MFGFNIISGSNNHLEGISKWPQIVYDGVVCQNFMIKKFENDKVFSINEKYILILDGVILNRISLMKEQGISDWFKVLTNLYETHGECFFSELRGSFAGALYDKAKDKWMIFGDQLGTKYVFYSLVGNFFACAEMCDVIYDNLKNNYIEYELDVENAKLLLSYGYMVEDRTLCSVIKKIQPGCYIVYENGQIVEKRYYLLNNEPNEKLSEQETIDKIDFYFRQAVKRQFDKDNEYGYKHIVALSGGLDSRMTSFVAHELGYTDQLNCTFSQTNYWDETVPKQMAAFMKHEWLFKSLDNGIWLKDVDEVTKLTGGNVAYHTVAHGNSLLKYINFEDLGLSHTGQIGDATISTDIRPGEKYEIGFGAYNSDNIGMIDIQPSMSFKNKEIGFYYYRALSGANAGIQYLYNYTESLSPFLDLDFLEFALSIPYKYRHAHYIYKKWVIQKYPQAAQFVWEKIGCKITDKTIEWRGHSIPVKKLKNRVMAKLRKGKSKRTDSIKHMNPYGYYFMVNDDLRFQLLDYFKYIDYVKDDTLKAILLKIKSEASPLEVLLAVSLLSAIKKYYC